MTRMYPLLLLAVMACGGGPTGTEPADARAADAIGAVDASAPPPDSTDTPPTPQRLYVACFLGGIFAYDVAADGTLTAIDGAPFDAATHLQALVFDPEGDHAYAVDDASHLLRYDVLADGSLRRGVPDVIALDAGAQSLAVDPVGRHLYVPGGGEIEVFAIDDAGALAPIDGSPFQADGAPLVAAVDPSGRFLYATRAGAGGVLAFALLPDGAPVAIGDTVGATSTLGGGIAVAPDGGAVYTGGGLIPGVGAFAIGDAGTLTELPGSPLDGAAGSDPYATDVAVDPAGRYVFSVRMATGDLHVLRAADLVDVDGSPSAGGGAPYAVAVDPSGHFVAVPDDNGAISVFAYHADGTLTRGPDSPLSENGLQPQPVFAPR